MAILRIVLADDHGVLRAGIRSMLEGQPDMEVVGEADGADTAIDLVQRLRPDLALVDVRMPGSGLHAAERMKQALPDLKILILSQYDDPAYLHRALAIGVSGYALKRMSGQELLHAIRAAARGEVYLHPVMARVLVEGAWGLRPPQAETSAQPLSERETQVLRLTALGYITRQIGGELGLSVRTVETYKERLVEKLGLHGRVALVRYALEHGLLESDTDQ